MEIAGRSLSWSIALLIAMTCAHRIAAADDQLPAGRDPSRVSVAAGVAMFASYPGSMADVTPTLLVSKPHWLGGRHAHFQWVLETELFTGFGADSHHAHIALAPEFGFNLYLGSIFGFEMRTGLAAILQAGRDTVVGLGLAASGGYVFRFWEDDRRRLKLLLFMLGGVYLADDSGNDLGMNAGGLGVALGYETPL